MGNPLVRELVKPIKVARSWPTDQIRFDQLLVIEAKAGMEQLTHLF